MLNKPMLTIATAASLLLALSSANAADLKVFVGGAMTETVEKIGAGFAKASGNKLNYVSDTTGSLLNRLKAGEKADVLVVTAPAMDGLQKDKAIVEGSRAELVRALLGLALTPRDRAPPLPSPYALSLSLRAARSVPYDNPN